ncbi:hypothetical protein TrVFT333_006331 [Trichoderma virens FT-333]|nr:hypothetical protein TrVFT333_006331 [Trichoderma virens FT-333]
MDGPTPIVIGLDGLIKHSLPRIAKIRSAAAAMTNFGRLSPFLKRLQVSVLLLGTIYRKISQYDTIPGSDMCLGICHDSLAQTQGMMEAVLRTDDDNAYKPLIMRRAQSEFILESLKELANLRRDYSKHLEECTHKAKQANPNITNTSSEDERTSGSDNGTNLTEPEAASPPNSSQQKPPEKR